MVQSPAVQQQALPVQTSPTHVRAAAASPPAGFRRAAFGANAFKAIPPKNFFKLWFGNLKDPTLIMLMVAAMVSKQARAGGAAQGAPPEAGAAAWLG